MSKATVLVVDDEKDVIELVRYNLEKDGYDVIAAHDGESGLEIARNHAPDLILLDLMLPGMDGIAVCRKLREESRTASIPIIMVTAKAEETDRVVGLEIGADDYVSKPFSPRELRARVRALLRRMTAPPSETKIVKSGGLTIDLTRHEVLARSTPVQLTATEFRILHLLAEHPGRVYSRNEIIDEALGRDTAVLDRTIDVHITAIRRKLGECGDYVETLRGVGYRLTPPEDRRANS